MNENEQGSRAETPAPPITSMPQASQAVANYDPEELHGLKPHKVKWNDLAALAEELNHHVLRVLMEYNADDEGAAGSIGPALVGCIGFANRLLSLTYHVTEQEFAARDFDWDQGAQLLALALQVNFRDLQGVVDFFGSALSGVLSVLPSSQSTPANSPTGAAAA